MDVKPTELSLPIFRASTPVIVEDDSTEWAPTPPARQTNSTETKLSQFIKTLWRRKYFWKRCRRCVKLQLKCYEKNGTCNRRCKKHKRHIVKKIKKIKIEKLNESELNVTCPCDEKMELEAKRRRSSYYLESSAMLLSDDTPYIPSAIKIDIKPDILDIVNNNIKLHDSIIIIDDIKTEDEDGNKVYARDKSITETKIGGIIDLTSDDITKQQDNTTAPADEESQSTRIKVRSLQYLFGNNKDQAANVGDESHEDIVKRTLLPHLSMEKFSQLLETHRSNPSVLQCMPTLSEKNTQIDTQADFFNHLKEMVDENPVLSDVLDILESKKNINELIDMNASPTEPSQNNCNNTSTETTSPRENVTASLPEVKAEKSNESPDEKPVPNIDNATEPQEAQTQIHEEEKNDAGHKTNLCNFLIDAIHTMVKSSRCQSPTSGAQQESGQSTNQIRTPEMQVRETFHSNPPAIPQEINNIPTTVTNFKPMSAPRTGVPPAREVLSPRVAQVANLNLPSPQLPEPSQISHTLHYKPSDRNEPYLYDSSISQTQHMTGQQSATIIPPNTRIDSSENSLDNNCGQLRIQQPMFLYNNLPTTNQHSQNAHHQLVPRSNQLARPPPPYADHVQHNNPLHLQQNNPRVPQYHQLGSQDFHQVSKQNQTQRLLNNGSQVSQHQLRQHPPQYHPIEQIHQTNIIPPQQLLNNGWNPNIQPPPPKQSVKKDMLANKRALQRLSKGTPNYLMNREKRKTPQLQRNPSPNFQNSNFPPNQLSTRLGPASLPQLPSNNMANQPVSDNSVLYDLLRRPISAFPQQPTHRPPLNRWYQHPASNLPQPTPNDQCQQPLNNLPPPPSNTPCQQPLNNLPPPTTNIQHQYLLNNLPQPTPNDRYQQPLTNMPPLPRDTPCQQPLNNLPPPPPPNTLCQQPLSSMPPPTPNIHHQQPLNNLPPPPPNQCQQPLNNLPPPPPPNQCQQPLNNLPPPPPNTPYQQPLNNLPPPPPNTPYQQPLNNLPPPPPNTPYQQPLNNIPPRPPNVQHQHLLNNLPPPTPNDWYQQPLNNLPPPTPNIQHQQPLNNLHQLVNAYPRQLLSSLPQHVLSNLRYRTLNNLNKRVTPDDFSRILRQENSNIAAQQSAHNFNPQLESGRTGRSANTWIPPAPVQVINSSVPQRPNHFVQPLNNFPQQSANIWNQQPPINQATNNYPQQFANNLRQHPFAHSPDNFVQPTNNNWGRQPEVHYPINNSFQHIPPDNWAQNIQNF